MESLLASIWGGRKTFVYDNELLSKNSTEGNTSSTFLRHLFRYASQCEERLSDSAFSGELLTKFNSLTSGMSKDEKLAAILMAAREGEAMKRQKYSFGLAFVGQSRKVKPYSEATLNLLAWFFDQISARSRANSATNFVSAALAPVYSAASLTGVSASGGSHAYFFPSETSFGELVSFLNSAKSSLDICVFNITDNDIVKAILKAKSRGVSVRIVSDDEQAKSQGSDIMHLAQQGIPTKVDNNPTALIHHKFALIDNNAVLTGSYNWTKSARLTNRENIVILHDQKIAGEFAREFARLWQECRQV